MAAAMKEVIGAAAGITTFAVESARDLVQYMVRRGQMTQDEADKLIREAEAANARRPKSAAKVDGKAASRKPAVKAAHHAKPKAKAKAHTPKKKPAKAKKR